MKDTERDGPLGMQHAQQMAERWSKFTASLITELCELQQVTCTLSAFFKYEMGIMVLTPHRIVMRTR